MVRGLENIYTDEAAQAVPEIFKENIAAFGNKLGLCGVRTDKRAVRMADHPTTWIKKFIAACDNSF